MVAADIILFRTINNLANRWPLLDAVGIFAAVYLIFLLAFFALVFIFSRAREPWGKRLRLSIKIVISFALAFGLNLLIGILYFRPRPFVTLQKVQLLIEKSPLEKSFPSGHTTAAFAIAFSLFLLHRKLGIAALILAFFVGLGRIYAGVHYPVDILGGAIVGVLSAIVVHKTTNRYLKSSN